MDRLILPDIVRDELQHARTPVEVRHWIATDPPWVEIADTTSLTMPQTAHLGAGETAAIMAAEAFRADLVLVDDRKAVAAAKTAGLRVTGTLGLIDLAARRGFLDVGVVLARLRGTNFRVRPDLLDAVLARHSADRNR